MALIPTFSDDVSAGEYNYIRLNRENVYKDYSNGVENVTDSLKGYLILSGDRNALSQLLQTSIKHENNDYESLKFRILPKVSNVIPGYDKYFKTGLYNTSLNSSVYFRVKPNIDSNSDDSKSQDISLVMLGSNKIKLSPEKTDKTILSKDTNNYVCSLFGIRKTSSRKTKKGRKYVLMTDGFYIGSGSKKEYIDGKQRIILLFDFNEMKLGSILFK